MKRKILVIGADGLVGTNLVPALQKKVGGENVVSFQLHAPSPSQPLVEVGDVRDAVKLESVIKNHQITEVYHLAALLSAQGEKNPEFAWDVNVNGLRNVLLAASRYHLKVFWPSTIAAFGPTTPKEDVPQHTTLEPTTMYGVTKVTGELLCQYFFMKFGVDVRSLRFPGLLSYKGTPGDGTTEYAIHIFYGAIQKNHYTSYINRGTVLPMMYIDDAIKGTLDLMDAPKEKLSIRTSYNFSGIQFAPEELAKEILRHSPGFTCDYQPDSRQKIAESWPHTIDDSQARKDWGWKPSYDLKKMADVMFEGIKRKLNG